MTVIANAPVARNGLLLSLDLGSKKKFLPANPFGGGNIVTSPTYNSTNWLNIFPANADLITGIDSPDGKRDAIRFHCRTTGSSLLRVLFPTFTPSGTDEYTLSFFVRKIAGTQSTSGQLWADVRDMVPSIDYAPKLIANKWTYISVSHTPSSATSIDFVDLLSDNTTDHVLDFWGVSIKRTAADDSFALREAIQSYEFRAFRPKFLKVEENFIQFDRTLTGGKWGGSAYATLTGDLESKKFLYRNHTLEIWFRIDDAASLGVVNEGWSNLASYAGYHAGLSYDGSNMFYYMWTGTTTTLYCATWTIGTSGTHIKVGNWHQLVVTRNGDTFTPYIDGVPMGNGSTTSPVLTGVATGNDLYLGGVYAVPQGTGNYIYYAKNSVGILRMYNRALTAAEVQGNFNANRSRFGI